MEGRTIVRPDVRGGLQQETRRRPFNGGPDNRPARPNSGVLKVGKPTGLQWRAGQSSGQTVLNRFAPPTVIDLQWRAGQSSGQTSGCARRAAPRGQPSMEGRTIVRPDLLVGDHPVTRRHPSMEGRTIVRPDRDHERIVELRQAPSMEGRTIVRPDACSAISAIARTLPSMEGRTIVRPDEGAVIKIDTGDGPSMEGRTIVRPDRVVRFPLGTCFTAFNGGPDNRPARPGSSRWTTWSPSILQWRAGQSSGQTNHKTPTPVAGNQPSMEGRTIVRPDGLRPSPIPIHR